MAQHRVLVVSAFNDFALNVLRCLGPVGARGHVMAAGNLAAVRLSRFCAGYLPSSLEEIRRADTAVVERMEQYCARHAIGLVMPSDISSTFFLSRVADRLSRVAVFPVPTAAVLETMHNKWLFARFLEKHGLPAPKTRLLERSEAVDSIGLRYPLVVKPLAEGNQTGIRKVASAAELKAYLAGPGPHNQPPLLAQEYLPGRDIDLNVLAKDGRILAWTVQESVPGDAIRFVDNEGVVELGRRLLAASGFSGVANIDLRISAEDGSIQFIECNPRFWGSLRASYWDGTNFAGLGLLAALGKPLPAAQHRGIRYASPSRALASALSGDFSALKSFSRANLDDLWQAASDPVPFLYLLQKRFRRGKARLS